MIVEPTTLTPLAAWESFYVIVGSSAAALTGLQFVVIVLAADVNKLRHGTTHAFATPTIIHFCSVLLISAVLSAPWHGLSQAGVVLIVLGIASLVYVFVVILRVRRQTDYMPVFSDWFWHSILPLIAYSALVIAAIAGRNAPVPALFAIAAVAILLLFVGIHNAWDAVTWVALTGTKKAES